MPRAKRDSARRQSLRDAHSLLASRHFLRQHTAARRPFLQRGHVNFAVGLDTVSVKSLHDKELRQTKKGIGAKSGALFKRAFLALLTLLCRGKPGTKIHPSGSASGRDKLTDLLQLAVLWLLLLVAGYHNLSDRHAIDVSVEWAVSPRH